MNIYFGGTEVPSWRSLLAAEQVEHVAMSYMGLRRRVKFARPWVIADKFPESQKVFLDSGAHTVNKDGAQDKYTVGELKDLAAHYMGFAQDNVDRLSMVTEFDAMALGREWIEAAREDFWVDFPDDKFVPVWHAEWGVESLDRLARKHERVGVLSTDLNGRNLVPTLNGLVRGYGTKLHGVNMSKIEDMAAVEWDSISTISWLSPSQYGDTIVWTGKELKRYPKSYKDVARKRHRTLFADHGFDPELIEADDSKEVLRLSVWSWRQQMDAINGDRSKGGVVSTPASEASGANTETGGDAVGTSALEVRKEVPTLRFRSPSEKTVLPVLGVATTTETYFDADDGVTKEREVPLLRSRSESLRICRTCFLAAKCPAYDPGANCAYDIPIEVKTKDQARAVFEAMIEIQTQRVLFMKMSEDIEGGYADPNLSTEMDRLTKMFKAKADMEADSFSVTIHAKERGEAGMISRIFGDKAGQQVQALPSPVSIEQMAIESQIIDAELA